MHSLRVAWYLVLIYIIPSLYDRIDRKLHEGELLGQSLQEGGILGDSCTEVNLPSHHQLLPVIPVIRVEQLGLMYRWRGVIKSEWQIKRKIEGN